MIYAIIFWTGIFLLVWAWAGYPAILGILSWRRQPLTSHRDLPVRSDSGLSVTIIVPVYNAEQALERKLRNCLNLDYPRERFNVIVASDGSSDGSPTVARRFAGEHSNIDFVESAERLGKSAVQNLAAATAVGDILLLTDVDAVLSPDALRLVTRLFRHAEQNTL